MSDEAFRALAGEEAAPAPAPASIVPPEIREAAAADEAAPPAATSSPAGAAASIVPAIDYDAEAIDLVEFAWACFAPLYPSLDPIYTPAVRGRIAAAAAPLMFKYGVSLGALGPELMFVVTVFPLIVPTYKAVTHDTEEARRAASTARPIDATEIRGAAAAANDPNAGAAGAAGVASPLERFPGQTPKP